ncbi:MAG: molybdopterin-dependent oxidoreductase [Micromonosporaceae bacterium]|nr:molybdopterin-dependent oxidoreductase [Micromonosporaceae bacterium]
MRVRAAGGVAGVAAAAVALAVAELVTVATGSETGPLVAVGGVVVDNSPEPATEFAISTFGVHDKTALLVGIVVVLAGAAALLGAAATRRLWIGLAGLGGFAAVGVVSALTRHDATAAAVVPTLVGAAAAGGTFVVLQRRLIMETPEGHADDTPTEVHDQPSSGSSRRGFLGTAAGVLGGAAVVGFGGRWVATQRDLSAARAAVALPGPVDPAPAVPVGADLRLPDLDSYLTGNDDFYRIDTALVVPRVRPDTWELRIHGRVRHPYTIDFADLLSRPMVERYVTLACVSNQVGGGLIGNARWLGVPVAELLAAAEPEPGADQVVSRAVDGWTCGTPTAVLTDGRDALLAVGMNGQPLPLEHGFPVRMVVPGLYGYVSACKWITEIELTSFDDYDAYWVPRGWAQQAPIKTQSRIDTPRRRVPAGPVMVAGVAWAQHRGIDRVEVRVDGGPWQEAELAETVSADTWRQWSWRWEATQPGEHELAVRATDATGQVQPSEPRPPAPDGATGWHTVRVVVED